MRKGLCQLYGFAILTALGLTSSCTHSVHLVQVSEFSPTFREYAKGQLIRAKGEQFVIMGFITDTQYVNQAYSQLMASCPQGTIQGITTQYSTSHGFLSWTNYVEMQGLCVN